MNFLRPGKEGRIFDCFQTYPKWHLKPGVLILDAGLKTSLRIADLMPHTAPVLHKKTIPILDPFVVLGFG